MTHDMALAIGLIWALSTIIYVFVEDEKPDGILTSIIVILILNIFFTAVFFFSYMVSYLIACGIR